MNSLPYDTNELLARGKAMLDQTKAQGDAPFTGSSFDTGALKPIQPEQPSQPVVPTPSTNISVTPPKAVSVDSVGPNTNVSALQDALTKNQELQQQYVDAVNAPKPQDEVTLEDQLNTIRQNALNTSSGIQQGVNLTGDQTIPMEFITGQQASIERRGQTQLQTLAAQEQALAQRLGVKQQERQGKLAALKEAIGMSQGMIDNTFKLQQAIQSQQDQVLKMMAYQSDEAKNSLATILQRFPAMDYESLDPQTQSQLAQLATSNGIPFQALVAGMKSTKDEYDFQRLLEAKKMQMELDNSELDQAYKKSQIAKNYADAAGGNRKTEIREINGQTVMLDSQTGEIIKVVNPGSVADETKIADIQSKIASIDNILQDKYLSAAVGPNWISRKSPLSTFTGGKQAFAGSVKQLTSKETMDVLLNLKKAGGTLGALSDQERIMLQNAATKIGAWEVKDDSGMGKGEWNVDEGSFKAELQNIRSLAEKALKNAGGTPNTNTGIAGKDNQQANVQKSVNGGINFQSNSGKVYKLPY